ncbi:hypothetical protein V8C42DRAFT_324787 [Trichoderma barbatum]
MSETADTSSKKKRSKTGCVQCRLRRIKCDERYPTCGRCSRVGLACSKPNPHVPLQQRRRGLGSIKCRTSWTPQAIVPNAYVGGASLDEAQAQSYQFTSPLSSTGAEIPLNASVTTSNTLQEGIIGLSASDASETPWSPIYTTDMVGPMDDPENIFAPVMAENWQSVLPTCEAAALSAVATTRADMLQAFEDGYPGLAGKGEIHGMDTYSRLTALTLPHPLLSSPPCIVSWPSAQDFPCMPKLDLGERQALDYYRTVFSPSRALKSFSCSSYSIFLRIAAYHETVLRFILALSLHGLAQITGDSTSLSPRIHLDKGVELLRRSLATVPRDHDDCVSILTASWLFMLFTLDCESPTDDHLDRHWLRPELTAFLRTCSLHSRGGDTSIISSIDTGEGSGQAIQSLKAKMICLIVVADIQLDFRTYTGDLAKLFCDDKGTIHEIARRSQDYLQLNYGSEYPVGEALYDVEGAGCSGIYIDQHCLYHSINQLFWEGLGDCDELRMKLEVLEKKCTPLFCIANTPLPNPNADYSRLRFQIDTVISEFYAIRVYIFLCQDHESSEYIKTSVSSYLQIRHRMLKAAVRYSWFDRSLFIIGVEVSDPIHRDWIFGQMVTPELKQRLTIVWAAQQTNRRRLQAEELKDVLRGPKTITANIFV